MVAGHPPAGPRAGAPRREDSQPPIRNGTGGLEQVPLAKVHQKCASPSLWDTHGCARGGGHDNRCTMASQTA